MGASRVEDEFKGHRKLGRKRARIYVHHRASIPDNTRRSGCVAMTRTDDAIRPFDKWASFFDARIHEVDLAPDKASSPHLWDTSVEISSHQKSVLVFGRFRLYSMTAVTACALKLRALAHLGGIRTHSRPRSSRWPRSVPEGNTTILFQAGIRVYKVVKKRDGRNGYKTTFAKRQDAMRSRAK